MRSGWMGNGRKRGKLKGQKKSWKAKIRHRIFYGVYRILRMPVILGKWLRLWWDLRVWRRGKNQKVCLVVNNLGEGGLEQVVMDLYRGYRKRGIETFIVCVNEEVSEYVGQIEDDPRHFRMIRRSTLDFLKFCRKNQIGVIHYHFSTFRMPMMRMAGMKTIYTIHNTYVWLGRRQWMRLWMNLQFCNEIVAVSDFVRRYFEEKTGIERVKTIVNGVDLMNFEKVEEEVGGREEWGFREDDVVLVMAASFTEQKYQMSLVGMMKEVKKMRPEIKVLMCGPVIDKKIFRAVKRAIRENGVEDVVRLGEKIPRNKMRSFLEKVPDAVILPSVYEGGVPPLSIVEALSLGVPAMMTDLELERTVFGGYVVGVKPVFENLARVDFREIERQIYNAEAVNKAEWVEKIMAVQKLRKGRRVKLPKEVLREIDMERMIEKYVELMK